LDVTNLANLSRARTQTSYAHERAAVAVIAR
jgi:hypothetical protein